MRRAPVRWRRGPSVPTSSSSLASTAPVPPRHRPPESLRQPPGTPRATVYTGTLSVMGNIPTPRGWSLTTGLILPRLALGFSGAVWLPEFLLCPRVGAPVVDIAVVASRHRVRCRVHIPPWITASTGLPVEGFLVDADVTSRTLCGSRWSRARVPLQHRRASMRARAASRAWQAGGSCYADPDPCGIPRLCP